MNRRRVGEEIRDDGETRESRRRGTDILNWRGDIMGEVDVVEVVVLVVGEGGMLLVDSTHSTRGISTLVVDEELHVVTLLLKIGGVALEVPVGTGTSGSDTYTKKSRKNDLILFFRTYCKNHI